MVSRHLHNCQLRHNGTTHLEQGNPLLESFSQNPMNQCKAGILYRLCFLPALTYPLLATWLPDQFFEKVHRLSTTIILNKMGFHQNLSDSMVFAPHIAGIVCLCNLHAEMEIQQLFILVCHMHSKTSLSTAMEILIQQYQLWAGFKNPVLMDTTPCPWIPD